MSFDSSSSINSSACFTFTPFNDNIIEASETFVFTPNTTNERDVFVDDLEEEFSVVIYDDDGAFNKGLPQCARGPCARVVL